MQKKATLHFSTFCLFQQFFQTLDIDLTIIAMYGERLFLH